MLFFLFDPRTDSNLDHAHPFFPPRFFFGAKKENGLFPSWIDRGKIKTGKNRNRENGAGFLPNLDLRTKSGLLRTNSVLRTGNTTRNVILAKKKASSGNRTKKKSNQKLVLFLARQRSSLFPFQNCQLLQQQLENTFPLALCSSGRHIPIVFAVFGAPPVLSASSIAFSLSAWASIHSLQLLHLFRLFFSLLILPIVSFSRSADPHPKQSKKQIHSGNVPPRQQPTTSLETHCSQFRAKKKGREGDIGEKRIKNGPLPRFLSPDVPLWIFFAIIG